MKEIVVDASLNQTRVALLEDGDLVEIYIERESNRRMVGNIYKGRITNVLPGMQAAFVDIGLEKNAFLYVKDAIPSDYTESDSKSTREVSIKDVVKNGQEIIVQVTKEPIGTKGARVTTHLTFPGRYLVLMPYVNYIGVSRRIKDENERERIKKVMEEIIPNNMGVIVRTAAEGKEQKDLKEDLKFLIKLWQRIEKEKYLGFAPKTIYKDLDLLQRTVRDMFTNDIDRFVINSKEKYDTILELVEWIAPQLKSRVEFFAAETDLYDTYNIEVMIKNALSKKVWLKSGGYIVIDQTEALTAIDVNTGKYVGSVDLEDTVLKINKEAAKEIAKQLRLRDIGGIIIIDFIDMSHPDGEKSVLEVLQQALANDRTKTNVLGITQLGLLEMTRKKVRQRISSVLQKKCPYCDGSGRVLSEHNWIHQLEREAKRISKHTNAEAMLVEVNPFVYNALKQEEQHIQILENEIGIKIFIKSVEDNAPEELVIRSMGSIEKINSLLYREQLTVKR
ncbi:Rne/Rng family ribonuclease [Geosporobacter ferrireducens]|uniref:Ribonuclease G n=1 Tax=Geosporobacter ferrireducens TaxID=1424294 RepID=A0A1D8GP79_9FIRM|nr:Rne/Rng family ribonuclease [Geosporobacter ferrireducens]AOT72766.1 ribonuclease G [Geosporobacter ferrireducens]MTI55181.1 Rne/Rng family ribonuclease [Geosporobacter ferrireducens]